MSRRVSMREANQNLAKYVEAVEQGDEFVITKRGRPVARLTPIREARRLAPEQVAARERTRERTRTGWHLGGEHVDRDAIYD